MIQTLTIRCNTGKSISNLGFSEDTSRTFLPQSCSSLTPNLGFFYNTDGSLSGRQKTFYQIPRCSLKKGKNSASSDSWALAISPLIFIFKFIFYIFILFLI